jgi:hypothetical protein
MGWYVTSQSFLFAAFAISGSAGHHFCWLSRLRAYRREIVLGDGALSGLNRLLRSRQAESQFEHFNRKAWIHGLGLAPPLLLPWRQPHSPRKWRQALVLSVTQKRNNCCGCSMDGHHRRWFQLPRLTPASCSMLVA